MSEAVSEFFWGDAKLRDLEELPENENKYELLRGKIVVSPPPSDGHNNVIEELTYLLVPVTRPAGWHLRTTQGVLLDEDRAAIIPDLVVYPQGAVIHRDRYVRATDVFLAVEVVSPSNAATDRILKPYLCAQGGLPLLLVIDPVARPSTVTLYTDPRGSEYAERTVIERGKSLRLPAPFAMDLDTSLLLPRP